MGEYVEDVRLPNARYGSDHICLVADLVFMNKSPSKQDTSTPNKASHASSSSSAQPPRKKLQPKLRTSWDVYNRLKWDPSLPYDPNDVIIGYHSYDKKKRVEGDMEMPYFSWVLEADGGDI